MRHQGFLDAGVTTDKKLDDAKKTVEFFLVVETGPAYTVRKADRERPGAGWRSGDPQNVER